MMPAMSPEEEAHSRAVARFLGERIRDAGGWLSFERFMEIALYAPGLGYYSAGGVKIGAGGDFVTAPEVSDLFSLCVARHCVQLLGDGGGEILERGAGTGRMAATILESRASEGVLPNRYAILEVSADLAARQRERLAALPAKLFERVVWLERLPQRAIRGVILANEVLDALPCRRFERVGGAFRELGVALVDGGLVERSMAADETLASACRALLDELPEPLPEGYVSEINLRVAPWIAGIGDCLERGALLLFDYGLPRRHYYHPQRTQGTLRCHFKHRVHDDPYANLGVQDITAWVDFTRVAEAAIDCGLEVGGYTTQAGFLLSAGIEQWLAQPREPVARARAAGEARRLLLPWEMGEAFKAMALTRGLDAPLAGFGLQDLRASL